MGALVHIDVLARLKQAAETKAAADPALVKALLAGGAGALLGGGAASMLTHAHDDAARERARNTAFGAGIATGMASPRIVGALNMQLNPAGAPL